MVRDLAHDAVDRPAAGAEAGVGHPWSAARACGRRHRRAGPGRGASRRPWARRTPRSRPPSRRRPRDAIPRGGPPRTGRSSGRREAPRSQEGGDVAHCVKSCTANPSAPWSRWRVACPSPCPPGCPSTPEAFSPACWNAAVACCTVSPSTLGPGRRRPRRHVDRDRRAVGRLCPARRHDPITSPLGTVALDWGSASPSARPPAAWPAPGRRCTLRICGTVAGSCPYDGTNVMVRAVRRHRRVLRRADRPDVEHARRHVVVVGPGAHTTSKCAVVSVLDACGHVMPDRLGTVTSGGPSETTTVTVVPSLSRHPCLGALRHDVAGTHRDRLDRRPLGQVDVHLRQRRAARRPSGSPASASGARA